MCRRMVRISKSRQKLSKLFRALKRDAGESVDDVNLTTENASEQHGN